MENSEKISLIKAELKRQGWKYEDLSRKSGIPISTVLKVLSGNTPHPRVDPIFALEQALGLDEKPYDWYMLTPQENELITEYRQLIPAMRDYILDSVKKLNDAQKK